jgi:hypothetical protein
LDIGVALGAGSIPEELFNVCYRGNCTALRKLRREALEEVAAALDILEASAEELKRRGCRWGMRRRTSPLAH